MSAAEHLHPVPDLPELVDFLEGDEPDWDAEPETPGDVDQVNRWLRRLARLEAQEAELVEQANNEIARIQLWLSTVLMPIQRQHDWLTQSLAQYHRARLARDPKAKTIALPAGTLKSRAQQPEWEYVDVPAFLAWARENAPDLVRHPMPSPPPPDAPDKNAAKKLLQLPPTAKAGDRVQPHLDGEVVPGVQVTVREPKFVVVFEGDDEPEDGES